MSLEPSDVNDAAKPLKKSPAVLKWAGGKVWLVPKLKALSPLGHTALVEPFVGAGALFLNTQYEKYYLSDINPDLISLYIRLKLDPDGFIGEARKYFSAQTNCALFYYQARKQFNASQDELERATLFMYLNRHGYNGLCRYNRKQSFNVPFGRYKHPYFPEKALWHFAEQAQKAQFFCEDFKQALVRAESLPEAMIYCDPPYTPQNGQGHFEGYTPLPFGNESQLNLAECAMRLRSKGGYTIFVSNHATQQSMRWYEQADKINLLAAPRRLSCQSQSRKTVTELLAQYYGDLPWLTARPDKL